jgi:hypothetical protein
MSNNDEARMTNDEGMTKSESYENSPIAPSSFEHSSFIRHSSFVIRHFLIRHSTFVILTFVSSSILAEPAPSAKAILDSVRLQQTQQQIDLQGQLRQDEIVVPFHLIQSGPIVRYIFSSPDESLQLQLGENDSRLDELSTEGVKKIAQFDRKIRGTNVTYEDLALKFLYWPNASVIGEENIRTRNCWKLQLRAPSRDSAYANVWLWVDKESGALMRMEGYNAKGQLVKRFEVISAQKIDNPEKIGPREVVRSRWFLKQMRIEQLQPGTNRVQSRTYLEIRK